MQAAGLCKHWGSRTIFADLHLSVNKGEIVALTGRSGSGKSTLLSVLGMIAPADQGSLALFGNNIDLLSSAQRSTLRRKRIGIIFQELNLIPHLNVRANLELGCGSDNLAAATEMLTSVGMAEAMEKFPRSLSLGEQQRVAAVRALAKEPSLILADEPTASLDRANRDIVLSLVRKGAVRGACVVVATHDPQVALWADRQISIDGTALDAAEERAR